MSETRIYRGVESKFTLDSGEVKKGLVGVIADETRVSGNNPENGIVYYQGYNTQELALKFKPDEVLFLLIKGRLPGEGELAEFRESVEKGNVLSCNI